MHYGVLADRVRFFKESKEGVQTMCKVLEEMRKVERDEGFKEGLKEGLNEGLKKGIEQGLNEGLTESMRAIALRMLDAGKYALDEIAQISGLSLDEVKKLKTG
jgi:flagellar biosynthesis/type III secretory pathway protein FliH